MTGEHRFLRVHDGVTDFAAVRIDSCPGPSWSIDWGEGLSQWRSIHGAAMNAGIQLAAKEHRRRGGQPQQVQIISFTESPSDTRPDAVTCAAALAAWESWGHSKSEADVVFDAGEWKVTFKRQPVHGLAD